MKQRLMFFLMLIALALPSTCLHAQTFDNEADWLASLCTENNFFAEEPFDNDLPDNSFGTPLPNPLTTSWGTYTATDVTSNNGVNIAGDDGIALDDSGGVMQLDDTLALLDGFGICYGGDSFTLEIFHFDGTTETIVVPATSEFAPIGFLGWTNTTNSGVSKIEISMESGAAFLFCADMNFVGTFCDDEPEPDPTCQDELDAIVDGLVNLLPTGNACDDYYISVALCKLTSLQDSSFWVDGDRLTSCKGWRFFNRAKRAIAFLQCTDLDTDAEIQAISDLLSCLVDAEIQYAIDAEGNACDIVNAECYRDYAQSLEDAGYARAAAKYRKYAWYYARLATY